MAEFAYPFSAGAGAAVNETDWSHLARNLHRGGVIGDPGSAALQVFADSSGRQCFVRPGMALVRGHFYLLDAQKTITLSANASGQTRIDTIVLVLDPSSNTIIADKHEGTPGAGAPTLTQTDAAVYELPLANVTVPNGAVTTTAAQVADRRLHDGIEVIACRAVADLDTSLLRFGTHAAELSTGLVKWWNLSAWKVTGVQDSGVVTSGFTALTGWAVTAGTQYEILAAKLCVVTAAYLFSGSINITANGPPATPNSTNPGNIADTTIGSMPAGARPVGRPATIMFDVGGIAAGFGQIMTDGTIVIRSLLSGASIVAGQAVHFSATYICA